MTGVSQATIIPIIISIVVILIILFSLYITFKYSNPEQYKKTRINIFFSTLASVAILFVGFNIILTSLGFEYSERFSRLTKTKEAVDKLWLYPNEVIKSSIKSRPEFLASFFMNKRVLYNLVLESNKKTVITKEAIMEEQFIATILVQAWEDCLALREYDETPLEFWLRSFLTWAQNPYFKEYYEDVKFEYQESTNLLAELLFEYANKIAVPTIDTAIYEQMVEKITQDSRYLTLLKMLP